MLSRRNLRIKTLQALYAFYVAHSDRPELNEKELRNSINRIYDVYIYHLTLLTEIVSFARKKIETAKQKYFPTEEDLHPNTRFVDNKVILQLETNQDLLRHANRLKVNWSDQEEMIRKLYVTIRESKDYQKYISSADHSYQSDQDFLKKIIKKYIIPSALLHFYFEEKYIHWADDFFTAGHLMIKTVSTLMDETWNDSTPLPPLLESKDKDEETGDLQFAVDLMYKTILHGSETEDLVKGRLENWELDRVALVDMLLIKMAVAEILSFRSIPTKVTMNEYLEIAKLYSTPKSSAFINGLLDKIIAGLNNESRIVKTGRGLMD
jgi:N utilization substance protein B